MVQKDSTQLQWAMNWAKNVSLLSTYEQCLQESITSAVKFSVNMYANSKLLVSVNAVNMQFVDAVDCVDVTKSPRP